MNTRTSILAAGAGCLIVAGAASAGAVEVGGLNSGFTIESTSMSHLFAGSSNHGFTDPDVRDIHNSLHAAGIVTEARVTFMLIDTSLGLSFVSLIDDHVIHGDTAAQLSMVSTAPSTADFWVNDFSGDMTEGDWYVEGATTTVAPEFRWIRGDGFAWSGLVEGDAASFVFTPSGITNNLTADSPYQFVTPSESGWDVVWSGDYAEDGELAFDFVVTATPAPGALALLVMAGLSGRGRRRRRF